MKSMIMMRFSIVLIIWINVAMLVSADGNPIDEHRSKINVQKNNFDFLFFEDIRDGDIKRVEKYLIFATQDDKDNGLVIAALAGRAKIAKLLINKGASVKFIRHETSPLLASVIWAEVCYNAGAFCDSHEANNVLKVIIEKGVDVNEDNSKYKILNYVAEKGFIETVELLIDAEANVNAADEHGWTPLHKSTSSHDIVEIVELLCDHGANIDAQNMEKNTPLQYAALGAHFKSVKFLLKRGANRSIKNISDQTALDMAKAGSTKGIARQRSIEYLQMCYVIRN